MKPMYQGLALVVIAAGMAAVPATVAQSAPASESLTQQMTQQARGEVKFSRERATGQIGFVRTRGSGDLMPGRSAENAAGAAAKASAYLAKYAPSFGARAGELKQQKVTESVAGWTVSYTQQYQGMPVFGGELRANVDADGRLRSVNGFAAPDLALSTAVRHSADEAAARAVSLVKRKPPAGEDGRAGSTAGLSASKVTKVVYRIGSTRGTTGKNIVAYTAIVSNNKNIRDFVVLDANSLKAVNRWSMVNDALERQLNTYDDATDSVSVVWKEGDPFPGDLASDQQNLLTSTAETYGMFKNTFDRDSYDDAGSTMVTLHNSPEGCPNASWNGQFTQYCDGVEDDDTVAHEWGHAYTEYTSGLVYQWQSGALNESYSDVWGETVDLLNNREDDNEGDLTSKRPDAKCSTHTRGAVVATIDAPASVAGPCASAIPASFGPQFSPGGTTGTVVVATDAAEEGSPTTTDGCSAIDNAADVAGKWAYVDRGTCAFVVKIQHVIDAGAAGIVVGNSGATGLSMVGNYPDLTGVMIGKTDGDRIKSAGGPVTLTVTEQPRDAVDSYRWLLSEGSTAFGGAIRDMWNPTCYGDPGKVTDAEYICDSADHGGVHGNSGVPNHAYALLVDGGTFNGVTSTGIGLDKAAALYFRSMTSYLTSTSDFLDQADALEASCADLIGQPIKKLTLAPGETAPAATPITADDCTQVAKVNTAVEFRTNPASTCEWTPMLDPNAPSACGEGFTTVDVWSEDFEDGLNGWVSSKDIAYDGGLHQPWAASSNAPAHHAGGVAYGPAPDNGQCVGGPGDFSSADFITSPALTIPSEGASPRLSFDHYVATEGGYDGGVVQMAVNNGDFKTIPATAYTFNGPSYLEPGEDEGGDNTNPLAGQDAFTGTDPGAARGSWGTSIIDLSKAGVPSSGTVQFRFGIGRDGCGGIDGWYVDNVSLQVCEVSAVVKATVAPTTVNLGKPATVTATVTTASGTGLEPRGEVELRDASGKVLSSATTASGNPVTLAVPGTLKAGKQQLTVAYLGNGRFAPASTKVTLTVVDPNAPVASTTKVAVKPAKPRKGKAFTLTAIVKASKAVTGKVTFSIDGKKVGTAVVRKGKASVKVTAKAAKKYKLGKHTLKATYSGAKLVKASSGTVKFTLIR